jgi:ribonuclease HII
VQLSLFEVRPTDRLYFEKQIRRRGFKRVAGLDEAGRGPLAGPVVAAAVVLRNGAELPDVNDSKQLDAARREECYRAIFEQGCDVGVALVDAAEIDRVNILRAALGAMVEAVAKLASPPDFLLIDGNQRVPLATPQRPIPKGDSLSLSIAAASIVAKVTRDRMMVEYHRTYPDYGFHNHKGYGTREHLDALGRLGPCPLHRRSFRGVLPSSGEEPS